MSKSEDCSSDAMPGIELWGGVECTIARIGDCYRDQVSDTGHATRESDMDAIAALGVRTIRYPILWEMVSPNHPHECDWSWTDRRLRRLAELGVSIVAGLVHHGSGPRYTNLLDPDFPAMLAHHAEQVARRYPWINAYTPVNEPLTTARFSGLYGHWYPHGRDYPAFLRCLVNECRAVVLAMQAIRRIRPSARLVQTEDLGKTFSTPRLAYQAEHDNERRWLSFDLLTGRIDKSHPWHRQFVDNGVSEAELAQFCEAPCPPDIMGINYYLTSDRFLDHRWRDYPSLSSDGNGRDRYTDVEAVRIQLHEPDVGPEARIREAWKRYGLPIAVTEVHNCCTREEQLRWFIDVWNAASRSKASGIDIRAVTAWSLMGAVDWNSLLTRSDGHYETGVFDVRNNPARPTILAKAARSLTSSGQFDHPVLDRPGWWARHDRFFSRGDAVVPLHPKKARHILLVGNDTGDTIAKDFSSHLERRALPCTFVNDRELNAKGREVLALGRCWAMIDLDGLIEAGPDVEHGRILANVAREFDLPLLAFSSDRVFDGTLGRPYLESDLASDQESSAAQLEEIILARPPRGLVIRTGPLFGSSPESDLDIAMSDLARGSNVEASNAVLITPTYLPDLLQYALDLLIDGETGLWHLTNNDAVSWHQFVSAAARKMCLDAERVISTDDPPLLRVLASERGKIMPGLDSALARYAREAETLFFTRKDSAAQSA